VVPSATLVTTYTGDFNDSAKAKEAAQAQLARGVKIIYPYLGGATDAVTTLANDKGVPALTPGTDRCGDPSVKYAISVIFSPGDYFAYALELFEAGRLAMGTARTLHMGRDAVPTVKICNPKGNEQRLVDALEKRIGTGKVNPDAIVSGSR
jgi:basic membrane protein A